MKRKWVRFLAGIFACFGFFGMAVSNTDGWFDHKVDVNESSLKGESKGAYYEKGNGTKENPFSILYPYHLYNLAWLQYLRTYDEANPASSDGKYYFKLSDNLTGPLNMDGYTLPPIGTNEHPFVSYFDGNGKTIENLTVSNNLLDYQGKVPHGVGEKFKPDDNVNIVGMFGVVGKFITESESYSSITGQIKDFGLDHITVKTQSSTSLIGALAGYVNGEITNVAINHAELKVKQGTQPTTYTKNISDYSTVGYVAKESYKKSIDQNKTEIKASKPIKSSFNAQSQGSAQGYGGSVDMKTMYKNLRQKWDTVKKDNNYNITYVSEEDVTIGDDGKETYTIKASNSVPSFTNNQGTYTYKNIKQQNSNDKEIASYSFSYRNNNDSYMYLTGGDRTVQNGLTKNYTNAFVITDNYSHYLTYDASKTNGVRDNYDVNKASLFISDENNQIYTFEGSTKKYLTDNNGTLSFQDNPNPITSWTYSSNNSSLLSDQGNYLVYDNVAWTLKDNRNSSNIGYTISTNGGQDLNAVDLGDTTAGTKTKWYIENGTNRLYTFNGLNQKEYLVLDENRSTYIGFFTTAYGVKLLTEKDAENETFVRNNNYINLEDRSSYLYYYRNQWWGVASSNYRTQFTFQQSSLETIKNYPSKTVDATYHIPETYYPLQFDGDDDVSDKNTGYVISGGSDDLGDIRVSQYPIIDKRYSRSNLGQSWNGSAFTSVYTINASGTQDIENSSNASLKNGFSKYQDSKTKMENLLKNDDDNIYGLHFMASTIALESNGHEVRAANAKINGDSFTNYQLPYDCIDFNLKDKGYVNFFAGTYFSDNDSFFSLYQVFRKSNKVDIESIKRITAVYSDGIGSHSYVYKYEDESYSVPYKYLLRDGKKTKFALSDNDNATESTYSENETTSEIKSGYTDKVFDTSWIEKQATGWNSSWKNYAAYYFEIPMNDGEFALGSVKGGTGSYLMYLDIGANADTLYRTTVYETVTSLENHYSYPSGIAVKQDVSVKQGGSVDPEKDNVCAVLASSDKEVDLTINRKENNILRVSGTDSDTSSQDPPSNHVGYVPKGLTLTSDGTNTLKNYPDSSETTIMHRMTYYDYSSQNLTTTKIVASDDGKEKKIDRYSYVEENNSYQADNTVTLFDGAGKKIEDSDLNDFYALITDRSEEESSKDKQIVTFTYLSHEGNAVTKAYELDTTSSVSPDDGGTYTSITGYTITVTPNKEKITLTIDMIAYTEEGGKVRYTIVLNETEVDTVPKDIEVPPSNPKP